MGFIWPQLLLSLALIPLGFLLFGALGRRRRRVAIERGGAGFMKLPPPKQANLRSRLPAIVFLAGFAALAIALARPQAVVSLPHQEGTVILAFDVSGSMAADDVAPTRLEAAKAAALAFVADQPPGVVTGVVAFSDAGLSVQPPTHDLRVVVAAIGRLAPDRGTSLAQGIFASLSAIQVAETGPNPDYYTNRSPDPVATPPPAPVPAGSHSSAVIVLITDGEDNIQPSPSDAAQVAAERGVRIYTVGIGSTAGTTLERNGFRVHTRLHEAALQEISEISGGSYYAATGDRDLREVYGDLSKRLVVTPAPIEVTALFGGAGLLLLSVGGLASLYWLGRLP